MFYNLVRAIHIVFTPFRYLEYFYFSIEAALTDYRSKKHVWTLDHYMRDQYRKSLR